MLTAINLTYVFLALILIAGFISIAKFIAAEKNCSNVSYSKILVEMIKTLKYKKEVLNNDYPEYHGELEKVDADEYIAFLDTGILSKFNSEESET